MVLKCYEPILFPADCCRYIHMTGASSSDMQVVSSQQFGILAQFLPLVQASQARAFDGSTDLNCASFNVAILESNASFARLLGTGLSADAAGVHIHKDLDAAMRQMETRAPDLLILDIDLEGMDGLGLLARLRQAQPAMRLLVLSGRGGVERAVEALNQGADDYLLKPFSLLEIRARVQALRRRSEEGVPTSKLPAGKLVLDSNQCRVSRNGRTVDLTPRECALLEFMMAHPGTTLSRATLYQRVWDMRAEANTNIVDVYVKYLRDKLDQAFQEKLIRTVRGVGYVLHQQL